MLLSLLCTSCRHTIPKNTKSLDLAVVSPIKMPIPVRRSICKCLSIMIKTVHYSRSHTEGDIVLSNAAKNGY